MFQKFLKNSRKVEIFSRHCIFSSVSHHKKRLSGFSKEGCYQNLIDTLDPKKANITYFLDVAKGTDHFLPKGNVIEINEGTESGAFLRMLDYVAKMKFHPDTILYFVEDDYLHRPGWLDVLLEGFSIPEADYITLYDHKDKYFFPMYKELKSRLFVTPTCHWRETPSTTQTFATRFKTFIRDLPIHKKYSEGRDISQDHEKFLALGKQGAMLISSIPGFSTHAEPEFASPCINWESLLTKEHV